MAKATARRAAVVLWLVAAPWLLLPDLWPGATPPAAGVLVLLWPLLYLANGRRLPRTSLDAYLLVFLTLTAIAFFVSPLPAVSLPKLLVILLGAHGYYVLFTWLRSDRDATMLLWGLAAAGTAVALAGPFMLLWPMRQLFNLQIITSRIPHLSGSFFLHHNEWAGTLVFLLPFAIALWRRGGAQRWLGLAATGIIIAALLLSQSRNALVAGVILVVVMARWGRLSPVAFRRLGAILALSLLAVLAPARFDFDRLSGWIALADITSKSGASTAASWVTRLEIWQAGAGIVGDYPLWGAGLYTFDAVSRANYPFDLIGPLFPMTHAHNLLLQSGASYGWPGLLTVALLWTAVLVLLWRAATANSSSRQWAATLAAAVIAYLTFNILDTITLGQKPGVFLWLILGATAALARQVGVVPLPSRLAGLPVALFILLLLSPARSTTLANQALDRIRLGGDTTLDLTPADFANDPRRQGLTFALQGDGAAAREAWHRDPDAAVFLQSQGRLAIEAGDIDGGLAWLNHAVARDPDDARSYFWRATAQEHRGDLAAARDDYDVASRLAREKGFSARWQAQTLFNWGRMLFIHGDADAAVAVYNQAIRLQPDNHWYYRGLGDALKASGDAEGAADAYRAADAAQ